MFPTVKSLLMSSSLPPSAGFCMFVLPQGSHPASADKVSDAVNMGKFMKKY